MRKRIGDDIISSLFSFDALRFAYIKREIKGYYTLLTHETLRLAVYVCFTVVNMYNQIVKVKEQD